ncbi:hypothetical protein niasHT_036082 [Heterodera trifolii]|uniref:ISXO2-like transposase domain-containing protein n=1 Tax=Heterodera trifolii TaxID=157864 RepID=A0ABD2HX42_9BILA
MDQTCILRRKYNSGQLRGNVNQWLFEGIEHGTNGERVFMVPVLRRRTQDMLPLIEQYIAPGSIIHSDLWAAYLGIPYLPQEYQHYTCRQEGEALLQKVLLAYRTTPNTALNGHSPDVLFLDRRIQHKTWSQISHFPKRRTNLLLHISDVSNFGTDAWPRNSSSCQSNQTKMIRHRKKIPIADRAQTADESPANACSTSAFAPIRKSQTSTSTTGP